MRTDRTEILDAEQLQAWFKPDLSTVKVELVERFQRRCAALTAVLTGEMNLTRAAEVNGLCRKGLKRMVKLAPKLARDGHPYGYRVCLPWGTYEEADDALDDTEMPRTAEPHAMRKMLLAQPTVAEWVDGFTAKLPPGRPPKAFERLFAKIVAELKRLDQHAFYPLNQPDKGRRALLRYLRKKRIDDIVAPSLDEIPSPPSVLADALLGRPFHRSEFDAHSFDIDAEIGVSLPNGGVVKKRITRMWFLCEVEIESRAILAWILRVGRSYNNLDLASCVARALHPWTRRELTIPGLEYAPGAGMPSGMPGDRGRRRARCIAMDNAKAHHAISFEDAMGRAHGAILFFGRAHEPRSRPVVEQLYSRLERGVFRDIPGGFEPATRLGERKLRISNFAPGDIPIQLHLFEELLDVLVANYNATPHPALGSLSPLQFLQMQTPRAFDFSLPDPEKDAREMGSVLVPVVVHGNRKTGELPHVNYLYVRYRSPELDQQWELVGKTVLARVCRHDLRTLLLMRSVTVPLGFVRAMPPWDRTPHDETTRALAMQWAKQKGGLSFVGCECAVEAYTDHLRMLASSSQKAVDQLARMQQASGAKQPQSTPLPAADLTVPTPRRGWISFDTSRDH
ncbi:hypothetical protein [Marilutibacter maris]|uniref:Integrase catalytic domain-containing protein n=1 Tax=Marilutibacter maris TaxID=1605891 RepID=A0A2U9T439_9GAMM|nr:hypothetical protein [Lysobacter maris]AWV07271.1 hypothetical protein C9I47_1570 [Lysobacter maris]